MYINANEIYQQRMLEVNNKINARLQLVRSNSNFRSILENTKETTNSDKSSSIGTSDGVSLASALAGNMTTDNNGISLENSAATTKTNINDMIKAKSSQYGVNEKLVRAVVQAESGFNSSSVSGAGAIGLMQLMPSTAKSLGVKNPYDPEQNIDGGIRYLRDKINSYNGNVKMALAAYNCGPTKLNSLHITDINDPIQFSKLPKETQNYINKIMKNL